MVERSGALKTSRLQLPKFLPIFSTVDENTSASSESISMSIASTSANLLNQPALPSLTVVAAREPQFPKPELSQPVEMTATKFPFEV